MPASYTYPEFVAVEVDPIAKLRSALKYTKAERVSDALNYITTNRSVSTADLAAFFLPGRRASEAIRALEFGVGTRLGSRGHAYYLTRRAKRRVARALAAELVMKQVRGTLKSGAAAPADTEPALA